MLPKGF